MAIRDQSIPEFVGRGFGFLTNVASPEETDIGLMIPVSMIHQTLETADDRRQRRQV